MMPSRHIVFVICLLLSAISLFGQTQDLDTGLLPYQSYHGGDIDSINLENGNSVLHLPLIEFPQCGDLKFGYYLFHNGKNVYLKNVCTALPPCENMWVPNQDSPIGVVFDNNQN